MNDTEMIPPRMMFPIVQGIARCSAVAVGLTILWTTLASAASPSPVGMWETVSDVTGEITSIVHISLDGETLVGRIEALIREEGEDQDPLCTACPGNKKDRPVRGLVILEGLTRDGFDWNGGTILDPESGKNYRCVLRVSDDNAHMEVRGYIGIALFGRTQVWNRRSSTAL